jgi:hypothetical protein
VPPAICVDSVRIIMKMVADGEWDVEWYFGRNGLASTGGHSCWLVFCATKVVQFTEPHLM